MNDNKPKVAELNIPAEQWSAMSPQQQLLYIIQQAVGFMASPYYQEFEGLQMRAIDINDIAKCKTVLSIGAQAGAIIRPN